MKPEVTLTTSWVQSVARVSIKTSVASVVGWPASKKKSRGRGGPPAALGSRMSERVGPPRPAYTQGTPKPESTAFRSVKLVVLSSGTPSPSASGAMLPPTFGPD